MNARSIAARRSWERRKETAESILREVAAIDPALLPYARKRVARATTANATGQFESLLTDIVAHESEALDLMAYEASEAARKDWQTHMATLDPPHPIITGPAASYIDWINQ